ncbi:MAG: D-alanine--D-alanine ligase [Chlorobium limicola]|uniref:D-alanine--D-alanine ligase n=1 Tax=Chlorobium limicola (strain DSM 245 / NBRC 103803 / 6330) TaxID=290315 RepID=DDL_CHLL2|nr:D-alanine--D-alanine ligase family protein [Chlorobium limicola]B3EDF4.1 RecName: Full=D-alanine--D-alanine ligase; AltName: Full=D-Ala-D-Ala ligase; AltName: Full=D-alanylalanine synthetase [Chlorobium limicola DSM 245]ACD90579.1 D-alanine/D-alanine ligase [Chlorobium limicola DSM 245]NTV20405.1 D-alanine--D-alanine ligase [Chlorobium limicola]
MSKTTIALLFGGKSTEHEISIISARSISGAIDRERYRVVPVYITHEGAWFSGDSAAEILSLDLSSIMRKSSVGNTETLLREMIRNSAEKPFDFNFRAAGIDVVFIALHGSYGEDGRVQGLLDTMGIPYTGCGVSASAIAMDKALTKLCAADAGVATAPSITLDADSYLADPEPVHELVDSTFGYPLFVKPASLGSSVGISKVHLPAALPEALKVACSYDRKILVEAAVSGKEIEVAVLGNDRPVASVPGEVEPGSDFYDFQDKYIHNTAKTFIPARLPDKLLDSVRCSAITVYKALGCRGMSRVDFFVNEENGSIVLNEINTIPGFTDISMYPKLFEASGIPFTALIDKLLHYAQEKPEAAGR